MPVIPGETRIGWVGTGVMGRHMAIHVLNKGFSPMMVYNRTSSKAQPVVDAGATLAESVRQVAENSDIILTMLGYPSDVREVISGKDGLIQHGQPGCIIVDLTTSDPGLAAELASLAAAQGKFVLDAPVSGGDIGAKNGSLSVMLGGDREAFEFVQPIIESFSKKITYFGPAGSGQHCKMGNQITIATNMIGVCEGLMYAHASGLDLETYLSAIGSGAAGSFSITALAPRIIKGDLNPGFYVEHFVKDLGIAMQSCDQLQLSLPGLALAKELYVSLTAHGEGRLGTQGLIRALERLNNRELPKKDSFTAW